MTEEQPSQPHETCVTPVTAVAVISGELRSLMWEGRVVAAAQLAQAPHVVSESDSLLFGSCGRTPSTSGCRHRLPLRTAPPHRLTHRRSSRNDIFSVHRPSPLTPHPTPHAPRPSLHDPRPTTFDLRPSCFYCEGKAAT